MHDADDADDADADDVDLGWCYQRDECIGDDAMQRIGYITCMMPRPQSIN